MIRRSGVATFAAVRRLGEPVEAAAQRIGRQVRDRVPHVVGQSARYVFVATPSIHTAGPALDPDLNAAAARHFGLTAEEIGFWRSIEIKDYAGRCFGLMLDHAYALEAWATSALLETRIPTLLLHVDAHDDLNIPAILPSRTPFEFYAPIGPDVMSLNDPKSVRAFIDRGFIGIGGFILPLIAAGVIDAVLHVADLNDHSYLETSSLQVGVKDRMLCVEKSQRSQCGVIYIRVGLSQAIQMALNFDGRILLDIDLDAFCNRFDTCGPDTTIDISAAAALATAADRLIVSGLPRRALVTTVALSPRFFPASLWDQGILFVEALRSAARQNLNDLSETVVT